MDLTITMNLDNDAFVDYAGDEIKRILLKAANGLESMTEPMKYGHSLRDINGNVVGTINID